MENKSPTICLLGASFGTGNMGVNALAAGTLKAFIKRYSQGELFLLDYGKERATFDVGMAGEVIPVELANIRFSKKYYLKNNIALLLMLAILARLIPFQQIRKRMIARNLWLNKVANADIVVSMAGGDSFSDIYGLGRLLYVSLPQFMALALDKKMVVLPQTIGPFKSTAAKAIARTILRRAVLIYSRDHEGVAETRELIGSSDTAQKVRFCYDVGFVLDPVRPKNMVSQIDNRKEEERPVVGLNISGLLYMGGYSKNNVFGLKIDYQELISDLIDFMIGKNNAIVMLVPHVVGSDGESDSVVCQEVYSLLRERYDERLLFASGDYNESEIKYIIGLCDFFIGSRMHACIAALSQSVPTVSIAYSRKFIGVMETIGVGELVADPRILEKEEIFRMIGDAFEQKARLRVHLEKTMPKVKETVLNLFNEIGSIPGGL
ncbi:MAG: PSpyruvtrans domain-containing protein [Nitrospira sp.]|nr:MAG: PSpyruvtrans domain-containing protein [Nitrospira sp.]